MIVAYKFLLEELAKYLETYLLKNRISWLHQHFGYIYQETLQNNKLQKLREWCNNTIAKYPNLIFDSDDFKSLQENALSWIIKQDNLAVEELKVWNYVIKWGIAQNSELPSNPKNWTQENFKALKFSIKNCLPFIRYFKISNDGIDKYVGPYKQIFEQQLWNNITNRELEPYHIDSKPTEPISTIVDKKHIAKIASWIDNKVVTYDITKNPYEFKLLLRGNNDGFTPDSFWKLCDQQENTVVIMKVKGTNEILGGYNPLKWDKNHNGQMRCNKSFIFSLNKYFVDESVLSRVKIPEHALYVHSTYGPTFVDLGMYSNFNHAKQCFYQRRSYRKSIINITSKNFSVDEYEVFKVIRKAKRF
ncbi:hypothetical protein C2G38_2148830 [Gigaspora rosea]|uniref:TLDc domain-containing protein n=1 Tax=Gigaspora rosea TaxID=44941 RepID=A0A397UBW3_9GLOM|nr:hypothetical protein C2G38_2148830 [Gigaspora rosea]